MKHVYLVRGDDGGYDSGTTWTVCGFYDRDEAYAFTNTLTQLAAAFRAEYEAINAEWARDYERARSLNLFSAYQPKIDAAMTRVREYDPEFVRTATYSVVEMPIYQPGEKSFPIIEVTKT